ncbi:SUMF1/EgtB/PvdO family nonheme iron enzyme [Croceivirga thetidis]|uniref:SUMF1/EgtB/PvdO family nonheme iron enzyme n=1 Tax=Croceivirga thetidis TaxID=2721623 RepID=UPI001B2FFE44|nr:SUMF1/EgtB/PvdO family nonheme iron enzyme [Croceivirga thetidis]
MKKLISILVLLVFFGCQTRSKKSVEAANSKPNFTSVETITISESAIPLGMVFVPRGQNGFFMDSTEVTNAEFKAFVESTDYITIAERHIDWEELSKQLPTGTPKLPDSLLQPGSLVIRNDLEQLPKNSLHHYTQWWQWKIGANWRQPYGPGSSIEGKDNHPVVHIAHEDALAYCKWKGNRLPTKEEWQFAAKGGSTTKYVWGIDEDDRISNANTWTGSFPSENNVQDGYEKTAPVGGYPPNDFGLYDMAGNVWEWTATRAMKEPNLVQFVMKGGSYLCSKNYCANYAIDSQMETTSDSSYEHLGFRTVRDTK